MKATDAFASARPRGRKATCARCARGTQPEERVLVRVVSFAVVDRKQVGLESKGVTLCTECARGAYDGALEALFDGVTT